MNRSATFTMRYVGPAVGDGTMPVGELLEQLNGLREVLEAGNEVLNSNRSTVKLKVVSTRGNSFAVTFALDVGFWDVALDLMAGRETAAVVNLLALVGATREVGRGIYWLLAKLRNRKVVRVDYDGMTAVIHTEDGDELEVSASAAKAYADKRVRKGAEAALAPLAEQGYTKLQIYAGDDTQAQAEIDEITQQDVAAMDETPERLSKQEEVTDVRTKVEIVRPSFASDLMWTLDDGRGRFTCPIDDDGFLARAESGESFKAGDYLDVTLRRKVGWQDGKLKQSLSVPLVHDHIPRQNAPDLFSDLGGPPTKM